MCCAEFIVKYVLFAANLAFSLVGLGLVGVGVAVLVQLTDILALIPVNVNAIPISVIVVGCVIFVIAFFGCCGAIRESRCLLTMYFICTAILAAAKIYLATVIFRALDDLQATVAGWLDDAFASEPLRPVFHVMEALFECCGTSGPGAYDGVLPALPPTCCATPTAEGVCSPTTAFGGCNARMGSYFNTFGEAIGFTVVAVIAVELVATIFGMFLCYSVGSKRRRQRYY